MAAVSNTPLAPVKSQNSTGTVTSRMLSAVHDIHSLPETSPSSSLLSCNVDQEYSMASSFSTPSDSFPAIAARASVAEASCPLEDASSVSAVTDVQQPESSDNGVSTKKQVWNVPSNGTNPPDIGAVMGADSWPALSKSARPSHKGSSADSFRALSHASPAFSQITPERSLSSQTGNNTSIPAPNLPSNHVAPSRQRSMRRGVSNQSNMTSNGSISQVQPIHDSAAEVPPPSNPGKSSSSSGESPRDSMHREAGLRGGTYGGNESHQQRAFRRSNSGPLARGDGSAHHGHGRRDQERGKQDWNNSPRAFGSRGPPPQQRVGSRPFVRAPVTNTPFISPSPIPIASFVSPMPYNEIPSPVFYSPGIHPDPVRYLPFMPYPMYYPVQDIQLPSKILSQIDYYFSNENLVKDTFLRQKMDSDGWVPISLIANFKKMKELTDDVQIILDAIQTSTVVEVQGDKVRRKNDWSKWIIAPASFASGSTSQSLQTTDQNMLAMHVKNMSLDENAAT